MMWRTMRAIFVLALLATLAGGAYLGMRVLSEPAPDGRIVLATGGSDGAYHALAQEYVDDLARNGVKLELKPDIEGWQVLRGLRDEKAPIDGGILKGGLFGSLTGRLASVKARDRHEAQANGIRSLGRLFIEPIWVFTRGDLPIESLRDLEGKRILTGAGRGGARRVAMQLLQANGVNRDNSVFLQEDMTDDAKALLTGTADAAIITLPPESERIQRLLRVDGIRLMNFATEAEAYASRFPALSKVVLHRGAVEFDPVIPSADITLLASSAALVIRRDLHPSLSTLLADAVIKNPKSPFDKTGDPVLFHKAGQFPSIEDPEFKVDASVRALYKSGELPFLLRVLAPLNERIGLPFSLTAFTNAYGVQTILLLIPALTILLPLARIIPYLYRWAVRQRLLYWYRELKALERRLDRSPDRIDVPTEMAELDRIDAGVRRIGVPLEFSDQLYDLRGHIDLVQRRLAHRGQTPRMAAE